MGKPTGVFQRVTSNLAKAFKVTKITQDEMPDGLPLRNKDPRKDYRFGNELGHGNYGVVHFVTHIRTGKNFACKILRDDGSATQQKHLLAEISALWRVRNHPNIITLYEVYQDGGYVYLVMEICSGGELFDVIMHRKHFSERDAATVMKVILGVIAYCHQNGVAHRDLKPENFLLKKKALDASVPLRAEDLRAVDFGLAVFLRPGEQLKELLGSPFYIAPELLQGKYSYPADCWSAGIILYILLSGLPPFCGQNEKEVFRRVLRQPLDLHSPPWPTVSEQAKNLVKKLLDRDPTHRPSAADALQHEWLKMAILPNSQEQSKIVVGRLKSFAQINKLQGLLMNLIAKNMSLEDIDALRDTFNLLDENGDGYLSFDELRQALEKDSGGIDNNLADRAMKALDISGDGFIEYHEFLAAAIDRQRILTDHTLADLFVHLDQNGDGLISPAELQTALKDADIDMEESDLKTLMEETLQQEANQPVLTEQGFIALMLQGMDKRQIQFTKLESKLSDLQYDYRRKNRFRQLALLVIARLLPKDELEGLEELFAKLDVDHDGQLSINELKTGLQKMDESLGDEDIEELVDSMDVDGNELIDYHEFVMGMKEDKQLLTEAKLHAAFEYFDKDKNGSIDLEEVEQAILELGIKLKQDPRELLALADSNDDQEVDFSEFREMMLQAEPNLLLNRQVSLMDQGNRTMKHVSSRSSSDKLDERLRESLREEENIMMSHSAPIKSSSDMKEEEESINPQEKKSKADKPETTSENVKPIQNLRSFRYKSPFDKEDHGASETNGETLHRSTSKIQENVDDRDTDADFEGQSKVTGNSLPGQSSQKERGRSHSLPYSKPNSRPNTLPRRSTNESLTPGRRRRTLVYLDSGNTSPSLVSFTTPDRRALDQLIDEADLRNLEDEDLEEVVENSPQLKSCLRKSQTDIGSSSRPFKGRVSIANDTIFENKETNHPLPEAFDSLKDSSGNLRAMLTAMDEQWTKTSVINK